MPIITSELKYYESTDNLGGGFVATEIISGELHNLFDAIGSNDAVIGDISYRCIYFKNTNVSLTLASALIYIVSDTLSDDSTIAIGLGTSDINGIEQSIVNEYAQPLGITFTELTGENNGLLIGHLISGAHKAIWLRRTILPDAAAVSNDSCSISVKGDTAG